MEALNLKIIITGGTFDKVYHPVTGELGFSTSHVKAILQQARITQPIQIECPFLVDSLDMTAEQRQTICGLATNCEQEHIVVTHGTDTIIETALKLKELNLHKTIMLTGAMVPYAVNHSDATFNLAFAIGACNSLPKGVYIAMQAQIFEPSNCVKNRVEGIFEKT